MKQLNLDEIVQNVNRKYDIDLKNLLSSYEIGYKSLYIYMYLLSQEIRKEYYNVVADNDESNHRAFNIRNLASAFDVEIIVEELKNPYIWKVSMESYFDQFYTRRIYVNKDIGDYSKRAAIAISLSSFIINYIVYSDTEKVYSLTYSNFVIPKNPHLQMATILAAFIMMPIDLVIDVFEEYLIDENNDGFKPIFPNYFRFFGYFPDSFKIADVYATIFFNHIHFLGNILYNYKSEHGINLSEICEKIRKHTDFFVS